jgi:hypothetical protein
MMGIVIDSRSTAGGKTLRVTPSNVGTVKSPVLEWDAQENGEARY